MTCHPETVWSLIILAVTYRGLGDAEAEDRWIGALLSASRLYFPASQSESRGVGGSVGRLVGWLRLFWFLLVCLVRACEF